MPTILTNAIHTSTEPSLAKAPSPPPYLFVHAPRHGEMKLGPGLADVGVQCVPR